MVKHETFNATGATEESRGGRGLVRWQLRVLFAGIAVFVAYYVVLSASHRHPKEVLREVDRLYGEMEIFREKFTSFPPNFEDERRFKRFVTKCFPESIDNASNVFERKLDAAQALVYWQSQISVDPRRPFSAGDTDERHEFYRFSADRLRDGNYYPKHEGATDPYVYFCWSDYETAAYRGFRPYRWPDDPRTGARNYFSAESAQIVGPGADGKLGRGGVITELSEEDRDNVVSFSTQLVGMMQLETE